jgi:hypothetical protein
MLRVAAAAAVAVAAACLASAAPAASAQVTVDPGAPAAPAAPAAPPRIELRVGETAERDVGFARGSQCDDPALVRAEVRAKSEQTNVFVVTGLGAGVTRCRVGTDPHRSSVMYEIRVLPRRGA